MFGGCVFEFGRVGFLVAVQFVGKYVFGALIIGLGQTKVDQGKSMRNFDQLRRHNVAYEAIHLHVFVSVV